MLIQHGSMNAQMKTQVMNSMTVKKKWKNKSKVSFQLTVPMVVDDQCSSLEANTRQDRNKYSYLKPEL